MKFLSEKVRDSYRNIEKVDRKFVNLLLWDRAEAADL